MHTESFDSGKSASPAVHSYPNREAIKELARLSTPSGEQVQKLCGECERTACSKPQEDSISPKKCGKETNEHLLLLLILLLISDDIFTPVSSMLPLLFAVL